MTQSRINGKTVHGILFGTNIHKFVSSQWIAELVNQIDADEREMDALRGENDKLRREVYDLNEKRENLTGVASRHFDHVLALRSALRQEGSSLDEACAYAAALRSDAEQWRAFVACRDHEMWDKNSSLWYDRGTVGTVSSYGGVIEAPDFPALLKKLDALRKPVEVWRWRYDQDGNTSRQEFVSAAQAQDWARFQPYPGHPVREVVAACAEAIALVDIPESEARKVVAALRALLRVTREEART